MMMSRWLKLTLAGLVAGMLAVALTLAWSWRELDAGLGIPEEGMFFEVRSGAALKTVTGDLERLGVIRHPVVFDWYARLSGAATRIHAGEYRLEPGLTGRTLLDKLEIGDVFLHQFTIVEGWRFAEMLTRLRSHPAIEAGDDDGAAIMTALGEPDTAPEGQFLPDTYSFPRGTADVELLGWAHSALEEALAQAWNDRAEDHVLKTPYDGLILASIIEKETALASERPLISGVFHRRLEVGMRLQTDPTVIYGLGDSFDGNLTRAHLATDTPYNTYTRAGLPPTPIALAGRPSIVAAFSPAETDALYFVATGEPDGSHAFSRTLAEHNAAVSRYLERQRAGD
jgi:UPF0755 protein